MRIGNLWIFVNRSQNLIVRIYRAFIKKKKLKTKNKLCKRIVIVIDATLELKTIKITQKLSAKCFC